MFKILICSFEGEVAGITAAVQLQPIKTTATVGKPLQSFHCAGPSTCQDLLCFQCPHHVFYCHIPTAPHKNPAFCGQGCSRKTKPCCQPHMRTLWDPHVILMKGSAQTGYRFFSASFDEYQNLLFLFRDLSGIEMKTCSLGIAVEIRDVCALFSQTQMYPHGLWVFPGLAKTPWNDQTELQTLTWECCPVVQTLKSKWEERASAFYDSKVYSFCSILHLGPKGIKQWRIL